MIIVHFFQGQSGSAEAEVWRNFRGPRNTPRREQHRSPEWGSGSTSSALALPALSVGRVSMLDFVFSKDGPGLLQRRGGDRQHDDG